MRSKPATAGEWIAYILAFLLIQSSMMDICLKVLHWKLFFSACLSSALAVGAADLALIALRAWRVRR